MATMSSRLSDGFAAVRDKFNAIMPRLTPPGGTLGQVLTKSSPASYSYEWTTPASGGAPTQAFTPVEATGNNTANQTVTLPVSGLTVKDVVVFVSGVHQRPTTDYTISGTTLTLLEAVPIGESIFVRPQLGAKGDTGAAGSGGGPAYTAGTGIAITGTEIAFDQNASLYLGGEIVFDQAPKIYGASVFNLFASKNTPVNTITAAAYTMTPADAAQHFRMDNTGANTFTIPNESSMVVGTTVDVQQVNTGQTTIVAASGVIFESAGGYTKLKERYSAVTIRKVGANRWTLIGALVA